jgi:hypothetical protein
LSSHAQHDNNASASAPHESNSIIQAFYVDLELTGAEMSAPLAARLAGVVVDQFLFFSNQVPL